MVGKTKESIELKYYMYLRLFDLLFSVIILYITA